MFNSMTDLVNEVINSLYVLRDYMSEDQIEESENELHSIASTYEELQRTIDSEDTETMEFFKRHQNIISECNDRLQDEDVNNNDILPEINKLIDELNTFMESKIV